MKPENVMIAPDGRVRILDFGLAKPLVEESESDVDATVALSGEGRILGTVAYMAPEQARGLSVDARSDHFSTRWSRGGRPSRARRRPTR